jgi:hypothetical protein
MRENMTHANAETGLEICYTQDAMNVRMRYGSGGAAQLDITGPAGQDTRQISHCLKAR